MPGVFLVVLLLAGVGFGAIRLNGTSQYGTIDDADACPESGEDFWLTVWFKRDGAPSTAGMIVGWTEGGVNDSLCNIRMNTSGQITFAIRPDGGSLINQLVSTAVVTDGNWHCVTIWRSGSTLNALVDNVASAYSYNLTGTLTLTRLCIGVQVRSGVDSSLYWAGEVAEVMVGRGTIDEATARALYNLGYPKRGQAPSTLYRRWPLTFNANASGGAGPNFTLTGEPTYADDSAFFSAIDGFTPAAISRSAPAIVLENDLESATSHRQAVTVSSSGWGLVSFVHNNADPDSAGATVTVQAAGARNRAITASASVYANRLSEYVENAADLFTFPFAGTFMTQVSVDAPAELKGVAVRFEPDYGVIPLYGHSFHCDPTRIVHLGDTWQVHTGMDTRGAVSITKNGTVLFTDYSAAMSRAGDDVYHMGSVLAPMPAGVAVFITEHNGELKVAYIADDGSTTSLAWADVVSSGGDATYARVVADDAGTVYLFNRGTQDGSNGSGAAVYHITDIPTGTPTVVYDQLGHDGSRQYPTHIELTDGLIAMAWTGAWSYGFAAVYDVSADKWYDLSKTQRGGNSKGDDTTPRFDATEWTTTQAAGTGLRIYGGSKSTYLATAIFDLTDWTNTHGAAAFLFSESAGSINEYAATTMRWVIQDGANTYVSGTDFDQPADWTCNSWRVFAKALWKDGDPTTGIAYLVMIDHDDREAGGNYDTALPTGYTPYYDQGGRRIRAYKITNPTDYTAITFTLVETVSVTGSDDLTAGFVRSVPGSANTFTWQEAVNELTEFKRQTDDVLYEFPSGGATVADFTITGAVSDGPYLVGEEILFDGNATTFDVGVTPDFANRRGFTWDFGDGITSGLDYGGISMVHVYTVPGTYTVTLTVLDSDGGTDTVSKTVTIVGTTPKLPPRAESTATMLDMAFNESLADDSANSYTIAWVDDGSATAEYSDCIKSNTKCLSTANGYVQIDDADTLEGYTAGFTLSVWFKRSAANAEGALVWKDDVFELYVFESGAQHPLRCYVYTTTENTSLTNWSFTGDDAWHNATVVYDAAAETATLYTDGVLTQAAADQASRTLSGTLAANANNLLIGHDGATRRWAGLIENVKIFNRPLSADEVSKTFTAERANFNSRIAQYIDYNLPGDLTEDVTNVLTVTLTADGFSETLATRTALSSTERVLLDHSKLAAGTYTLTAVVKNAAGTELDRFAETFIKGYDGIPRVGINEHNAICLNGVPFFPVTSFAINNANVSDWMHYATYPLVNLFYAQGNWPTDYDPNGWEAYLDLVVAEGSMAMGPSQWDGLNPYSTLYGSRYADTGTLVDYITQTAEHPGTFGWIWKDEPDLGGPSEEVPPATVASWSFLSRKYDPSHPTFTNLCGPSWVYSLMKSGAKSPYSYEGNAAYFGRKTYIADVMGFDYYPFDWRISREGQNATVAGLVAGLLKFRDENPHVPLFSFVETADIRDDVVIIKGDAGRHYYDDMTPTVTPAQIKMLAWLHVVLGWKGVNWFPYFRDFDPLATGAVNVTNGSTTVTGNQSTAWEPLMNGRTITIGGITATIAAVTWTETEIALGYSRELTLTEPWAGATASGVRYEIERNTPNWEAMGDFQNQMATYGPIVLDAPPAETVSVTANEGVVRAMLRKSGDTYYLFAVRQTEYGEVVADPGVTFTLSGVTPGIVTVLEESRSLTPSGATISDEFDANEVHIYSFKASGGAPAAVLRGRYGSMRFGTGKYGGTGRW